MGHAMRVRRAKNDTRASVLRRARCGEADEFCDIYLPLAFYMAKHRVADDNTAEDIAQEAVLHLLNHVQKPGFRYDPQRGSFRGLVKTIVIRRVSDEVRRRQRQIGWHEVVDPPDEAPDPATEYEDAFNSARKKVLLSVALSQVGARVKPSTLQSFQLYCLEGWDVEDVCRQLRLTRDQVYTNRSRMLKLLRERYQYLEKQEEL